MNFRRLIDGAVGVILDFLFMALLIAFAIVVCVGYGLR